MNNKNEADLAVISQLAVAKTSARHTLLKFLALSALLHATLFVWALQQKVSALPPGGFVLRASLLEAQSPPPAAAPTPPSAPVHAKPARAVKRSAPPASTPTIAARPAPPMATASDAPAEAKPAPEQTASEPVPAVPADTAAEDSIADAAPAVRVAPTEDAPQASATPIAPGVPQALLGKLPSAVDIDFELRRGALSGTMTFRWRRDRARYELSSEARALFRAQHVASRGELSAEGPAPETFAEEHDDNESEPDHDRAKAQFVYESVPAHGLADKTEDLLGTLLRFGTEQPTPSDAAQGAASIEPYEYEVVGNETLDIAGMRIDTLHLKPRDAQGRRGLEVWLAVDTYHLPVKIRDTDRDGNVTEMSATNIRVE